LERRLLSRPETPLFFCFAVASPESPVQSPSTLVAGARTVVRAHSDAHDSPNSPFWGPAGAQNQNLDPGRPPKPSQVVVEAWPGCRYGTECRFWATGTCRFRHESAGALQTMPHPGPSRHRKVVEAFPTKSVEPGALAGARTAVRVLSDTQDSPHPPFWGPAGAQNQNLEPGRPPKPSQFVVEARPGCRYGTECRFWAIGTCRFRHDAAGTLQTMPHPGPSRNREVVEAVPAENVEPGALADPHKPSSCSLDGLQAPELPTFTPQHKDTEADASTQNDGSEAHAVLH
jgi:hypothetical protein